MAVRPVRPHPSPPTWPSTPFFLLLPPRPPLPPFSSLWVPPFPLPLPPCPLLPLARPSTSSSCRSSYSPSVRPPGAPLPRPPPRAGSRPPLPPPRARCPPPPSTLLATAPPLPPPLAWALPLATPAPGPGSDAPRRCQPLSPGGRGGSTSSSGSSSSWSCGAVTAAHSRSPTASLRLACRPGTEYGPDPRERAVSGAPAAAPLLPPLPPAVELRLGGGGLWGFRGGGRGELPAPGQRRGAREAAAPWAERAGGGGGECARVMGQCRLHSGGRAVPGGVPGPERRGRRAHFSPGPRAPPVPGGGDCAPRRGIVRRPHRLQRAGRRVPGTKAFSGGGAGAGLGGPPRPRREGKWTVFRDVRTGSVGRLGGVPSQGAGS